VTEDGFASDDDVVEQAGRRFPLPGWFRVPGWRPPRSAVFVTAGLLAGLVIGLAGGYAAGSRHSGGGARTQSAAGSSSVYPALTQPGAQCSTQTGRDQLQVGVYVSNQSGAPVTLSGTDVILPLGGLRLVALQWAPCGLLPGTWDTAAGPAGLGGRPAPGAGTWLSATFQVKVACPGGLPVQFSVRYQQDGQTASARLPGFPDLGHVPYSGCGTS
jgi:hypothetical protein